MIEDWEAMYRALVRRLVEIADSPSATERMRDYDTVARAHERVIKDHPKDQKDSEPTFEGLPQESF